LCKILGLLIQPYLPSTSNKILGFLNCRETDWKNLNEFNVKKINEPRILFEKLESKKIEDLKNKTAKVTEYKIKK